MTRENLSYDYSIIVPCYNDGDIFVRNHDQLMKVAEVINAEVILVDDGSNYCQADLLKSLKTINVVRHKIRMGQTQAYLTGIVSAKTENIIFFSSDFEVDPNELKKLLPHYKSQNFFVNGQRINRLLEVGKIHFYFSRVANYLLNRIFDIDVRDRGSGVKIVHKEKIVSSLTFEGAHRFLPDIAAARGALVIEIPIEGRGRISGKSSYVLISKCFIFWINLWRLLRVVNEKQ